MTYQEIFDTVVKHVITQGRPATINNLNQPGIPICAYRTPEGLKCAIGCLITDEAYDPRMEGHGIGTFDVKYALKRSGIDVDTSHGLLMELQDAHDLAMGASRRGYDFIDRFQDLASDAARLFDLNTESLHE